MSSYQRLFWYSKVAENQGGEYCKGCGFSPLSVWYTKDKNTGTVIQKPFEILVVDKINNDGNHNIGDNVVTDFQLLCKSCNNIKNPKTRPEERKMSQSEATNQRAEKPLMRWLMDLLMQNKEVTWKWFVANGSHDFDISPETIEDRYYKKWFSPELENSPFGLGTNDRDETIIILKNREYRGSLG